MIVSAEVEKSLGLATQSIAKKRRFSGSRFLKIKPGGHISYAVFNQQGGVRIPVEKETCIEKSLNPNTNKPITETADGIISFYGVVISGPDEIVGKRVWSGKLLGHKGML